MYACVLPQPGDNAKLAAEEADEEKHLHPTETEPATATDTLTSAADEEEGEDNERTEKSGKTLEEYDIEIQRHLTAVQGIHARSLNDVVCSMYVVRVKNLKERLVEKAESLAAVTTATDYLLK